MKKASDRLKVSLHGMNDRAKKMMGNYLEMCCYDIAQVVEEYESDAEIIDLDALGAKNILDERLSQQSPKPIVVLSVQAVSVENVIYVKKPVDVPSIVHAIKTVKKDLVSRVKKRARIEKYTEDAKGADTIRKLVEVSENNLGSEAESIEKPVSSVPKWTQQQSSDVHNKENGKKSVDHSALVPKWTQNDKAEAQHQESETQPVEADSEPQLADSSESQPNTETDETDSSAKAENASKQEPAKTSSIHLREIDRLLKELHDASQNTHLPSEEKGDSKQNNRQTIRYAFHPIEAKLKKNSVMNLNSSLTVLVLNISSKGAIIELKKPFKLRGKTTLTIHFDSQNIFVIPARVVRRESKIVYGLQFLDFQHKLTDYLVNSGRSFFFT